MDVDEKSLRLAGLIEHPRQNKASIVLLDVNCVCSLRALQQTVAVSICLRHFSQILTVLFAKNGNLHSSEINRKE